MNSTNSLKAASLKGLVVATIMLGATSCAAIKGEPVENGMQSGEDARTSVQAPSGSEVVAVTNVSKSAEAFQFRAKELFSGALISGSDMYASGPVIVTFVSPQCEISVDYGSQFAKSALENSDITYVFVHTGDTPEAYEDFVDQADLYQQNVIHIDDSELELWERFGVKIQPSSVLVDSKGLVRFTTGGLDHEGLSDAALLLKGTL